MNEAFSSRQKHLPKKLPFLHKKRKNSSFYYFTQREINVVNVVCVVSLSSSSLSLSSLEKAILSELLFFSS